MRFGVLLTTLGALPALAAQVVVSDVTWVRSAPVDPVERATTSPQPLTQLELLVAPSVSTVTAGLPVAGAVTTPIALAPSLAPASAAELRGPCGMAVAFLMRARRQAT